MNLQSIRNVIKHGSFYAIITQTFKATQSVCNSDANSSHYGHKQTPHINNNDNDNTNKDINRNTVTITMNHPNLSSLCERNYFHYYKDLTKGTLLLLSTTGTIAESYEL